MRQRGDGVEPDAGRQHRTAGPGEPRLRTARIDAEHLDRLAPPVVDGVQRVLATAAGADRKAVRDELRGVGRGAIPVEPGIALDRGERGLGNRVPALVLRIQQVEIARAGRRARQATAQPTDQDPLRARYPYQILGVMRAADEVQIAHRRTAVLIRRRT